MYRFYFGNEISQNKIVYKISVFIVSIFHCVYSLPHVLKLVLMAYIYLHYRQWLYFFMPPFFNVSNLLVITKLEGIAYIVFLQTSECTDRSISMTKNNFATLNIRLSRIRTFLILNEICYLRLTFFFEQLRKVKI